MRFAVLGTGMVGRTIGSKLVESSGHEVAMGSRDRGNEAASDWAVEAGGRASNGTFAEAAGHGEWVFNCTAGAASLQALEAAGAESLAGKVLVDVANPLDFSGMPPTLAVCNDDSLGEKIQRALPETKVVKSLNTVNHLVMVDPARIEGDHNVFVCGNDRTAKAEVADLLHDFGWPPEAILDLGDISAARAVEMYLPLWLRLYGALGSADVNIAVRR